jgi:hypothetical protein
MRGYVHEVEILLNDDTDQRAPGGAVTTALCGHWEHPGACRWPHNNEMTRDENRSRLRTVFVASEEEEPTVRERIDRALRESGAWAVVGRTEREMTPDERLLAEKLERGSRSS